MNIHPHARWHPSEGRLAGRRFELTLDPDLLGFRLIDHDWCVFQPDFSDWYPFTPGAFAGDPESAILTALAAAGIGPRDVEAIFLDLLAPPAIDVEAGAGGDGRSTSEGAQ